jgi:uncharacterized protein (TIGR02118 family)
MVKMFAFPSRRADVSVADFHAHWRGPHRVLAERIPSFRRYVQSHRRWDLDPGPQAADFEGSAEVWFDEVAAALGMQDDPSYAEGAAKDEPSFIDMDRLIFIFTEEDVLEPGLPIGKDDDGVKLMQMVRRASGVDREEFAARWGRSDDGVAERLHADRHVACRTLVQRGPEPPFDGVREVFWADPDDFRRARDEDDGQWACLQVRELVDPSASRAMVVEELRVIWP